MTNSDTHVLLRAIPATDVLLNAPWAAPFAASLGREQVKTIVKQTLDELRREIRGGARFETPVGTSAIA
jgi:hypothetical protein